MTVFDYDRSVIGGGAAGLTAASGAAGAKAPLVEKKISGKWAICGWALT